MKRSAAVLVAGLVGVALALPAHASTVNVDMVNSQFDPTPVAAEIGSEVTWTNQDAFTHTATSNTGWFNKVVNAGEFKTKLFLFGGTFPYYCQIHGAPGIGMHGTVRVLDRWLNEGEQHVGDVQRIRIAEVKAPDGLAYDVQMRQGDGDWHVYKARTTTAVLKFTPQEAGEYRFRSRVHRLSNNKVSGFSPAVQVLIS